MTSALLILAGILGVATTVALAVFLALLTTEAKGNVPVLCKRLVDRAAARLPAEMQHRREEWESDLRDAADRPITQMLVAARIWRDGRAIAAEATAGIAESEGSDGRRGESLVSLAGILGLLEVLFSARKPFRTLGAVYRYVGLFVILMGFSAVVVSLSILGGINLVIPLTSIAAAVGMFLIQTRNR